MLKILSEKENKIINLIKENKELQDALEIYQNDPIRFRELLNLFQENQSTISLIKYMSDSFIKLGVSSQNKIENVIPIFDYINTLINGNEMTKTISGDYQKKYAVEALEKIAKDIQQTEKAKQIEELNRLKEQITSLAKKESSLKVIIDDYQRHVDDLTNTKELLEKEIASYKNEEKNLENKLKNMEVQGKREIENKLEKDKKEKEKELSIINEKIISSKKTLNEIQASIEKLNKIINTSNNEVVVWGKVTKDSDIYKTNYKTIRDYFRSKKRAYEKYTGVSSEQIFDEKCPGLEQFISAVEEFTNSSSINEIINYSFAAYHYDNLAKFIASYLSMIEIPEFREKQSNDTIVSKTPKDLPENLQLFNQYMHYQEIAVNALAREKIMETKYNSLLSFISKFLPKNSNDLETFDALFNADLERRLNDSPKQYVKEDQ